MKTIVTVEVTHSKPIPHLADMIAGRAWTIGGVKSAEVIPAAGTGELRVEQLQDEGFSLAEIALGAQGEVHRT
jgi:hypothetical protein